MKKRALLALPVAIAVIVGVTWSSARSERSAGDLLQSLPDGSAVAVIDLQKLAGSSLWAAVSSQEKLKSAIDKVHSEMADVGVKLSDMQTVAMVFPASGLSDPTVAMTGGFNEADLVARIKANGKVKLTSEKYKNFDIYKVVPVPAVVSSKEPSETKPAAVVRTNETAFVFHDSNTIVAGSLQAVRASVEVKTGARPSIAQNARLADALAQNPSSAIRFAIALTPTMTSGLNSSELPIPDFSTVSLVFGWIDVASGMDLNVTLRSDTAEHAKAMAERLNGLLGMAKGYLGAMSESKMASIVEALKTVSIVSTDVDVKITGSLPMEFLNSLFSLSSQKS
jgi:hypothetical protein